MPSSTLQMVPQEMQSMHNISQNCFKQNFKRKVIEISDISETVINDITEEIFGNDIFNFVHAEKGPLSTDYRRKQYFKDHFGYVALVAVCLGFDKSNVKKCFQYVPIIKTIQELLKDDSVKEHFDSPILYEEGVLNDVADGSVAKANVLFNEVPNSLKLILYQDSLEVVNPLGSAKKKHKMFAV